MASQATPKGSGPVELPILCFNDVYRVTQRYVPQPGAPPFDLAAASKAAGEAPKITVAQFGQLVEDLRTKWAPRPQGSDPESGKEAAAPNGQPGDEAQAPPPAPKEKRDGLLLFAGDVFNPSVESSVTRGSHMVPVLNMLGIDVACIGNHDFDFGYPHLTKLLASTNFPWLLSNIIDVDTGLPPVPLRRYWVTERCGVKIGVVGLVEEDWIGTIPAWPSNFRYRPMDEVAVELSKELRDPQGEGVDIIIALTHCRVNNDIDLCNAVGAVSDSEGWTKHGVDLLVGGHDHMYYIGKGAKSWTGFTGAGTSGTSLDTSCHLIKSGTDFRDLSSATLTLSSPQPAGSEGVRRRVIDGIVGEHHYVLPTSTSSPEYEELIDGLMATVGKELGKPVAYTLTEFDALSENVRTKETGLGNWVADVLRHAYAESGVDSAVAAPSAQGAEKKGKGTEEQGFEGGEEGVKTPTARAFLIDTTHGKKGRTDVPPRADGGADAVIICGGGLRGDSRYGPGKVTMGDILEILPYDDPIVCIELDGKGIRDTLEHALSKWPAQEGRFPIVSGIAVEWDHSAPPYHRVKSLHFTSDDDDEEGDDEFDPLDLVEFVEQKDGSGTRVEVKQRKVSKGEEVRDDQVYRVITRDYMAGGGDGFSMLKDRNFIVDDENGQPASSILRSFLLGSSFIFRHQELMDAHSQHLSKRTTQVLGRARDRDARAAARGGAYSPSPSSSLSASPQMTHSPLHPHPHGGAGGISGLPNSGFSGFSGFAGLGNTGSPSASAPHISPGGASVHSNFSDMSAGSGTTTFGSPSMNGSMMGGGAGSNTNVAWSTLRRHVVKHDRNSIRDALLIGRTEHMSGVDTCAGDELRSYIPRKPNALPVPAIGGIAAGMADLSVPAPALHKLSIASAPRKPPMAPITGPQQQQPLHVALEPKAPVPGTGSRQAGDVASAPPPANSGPASDAPFAKGEGEGECDNRSDEKDKKSALAKEIEKVKHDAEEDERKQRQGVLMRDDLRALGAELAIICPLVDGRMRDLAVA